MAEKRVSVRLAAVGGKQVRAELEGVGDAGVKGFGRMFARMGMGVYEIFTYPFPVYKRSYRPILRPSVPWVNGGFDEFPPEFGFQSKRRYTTTMDRY